MAMPMNNLGRDKLGWTPDTWSHIDQAVHDEAKRTKIAAQFLPLYPANMAAGTIQSDTVNPQTVPARVGWGEVRTPTSCGGRGLCWGSCVTPNLQLEVA